jgi:hypothetical protein
VKLVNRIPQLKCLSLLIRTLIPNLTLLFHQNNCCLTLLDVRQDSAVSIVNKAGQLRGWSSSPDGGETFLISTSCRLVLGPTQPPIQWVLGTLSKGVKQLGLEASHQPPVSAKVKNMWICTSAPPYLFMA